ncbi:hypothetical protein ACS0TY_005503 [Phlomoides rotata]
MLGFTFISRSLHSNFQVPTIPLLSSQTQTQIAVVLCQARVHRCRLGRPLLVAPSSPSSSPHSPVVLSLAVVSVVLSLQPQQESGARGRGPSTIPRSHAPSHHTAPRRCRNWWKVLDFAALERSSIVQNCPKDFLEVENFAYLATELCLTFLFKLLLSCDANSQYPSDSDKSISAALMAASTLLERVEAEVGKGLSKDEKAKKLALQHWLEG